MKRTLLIGVALVAAGCAAYTEPVTRKPSPPMPRVTWCEGAYEPSKGSNFGLCPDSAPKIIVNVQSPGGAGTGNAGSSGSAGETGSVGHGHGTK